MDPYGYGVRSWLKGLWEGIKAVLGKDSGGSSVAKMGSDLACPAIQEMHRHNVLDHVYEQLLNGTPNKIDLEGEPRLKKSGELAEQARRTQADLNAGRY